MIETRRLVRFEQSAECGQSETRLAVGQCVEDDSQALPAIMELIPAAATDSAIAEGSERITVGVELTSSVRRIRCVK